MRDFLKFQVRQQMKEGKNSRAKAAESVPVSTTSFWLKVLIRWFRSLGVWSNPVCELTDCSVPLVHRWDLPGGTRRWHVGTVEERLRLGWHESRAEQRQQHHLLWAGLSPSKGKCKCSAKREETSTDASPCLTASSKPALLWSITEHSSDTASQHPAGHGPRGSACSPAPALQGCLTLLRHFRARFSCHNSPLMGGLSRAEAGQERAASDRRTQLPWGKVPQGAYRSHFAIQRAIQQIQNVQCATLITS